LSLTSRGFGEAFLRTGAFTGLVRYETAIDRSFKSSLHELKALQEARCELGSNAPSEVVSIEPPAAEPPQPAEQTTTSGELASLRQPPNAAAQALEMIAAVRKTLARDRRERPESDGKESRDPVQQAA
ncbi:MAG: hypothetical protein HYZ57_11805, partial [Acidobacteria bacterium]|nr:hypothetical protein [Acidobacteriota bacterium]